MKDGKFRSCFSTYWIIVLIASKIKKIFRPNPNFRLMDQVRQVCAITTMPIARNKPIPIGSGIISGTTPGKWIMVL